MGLVKHGGTVGGKPTPEYRAWQDMIHRCYNPKDKRYSGYGGRGIWVCARWRTSFANFLLDMGRRPEGRSLERIDNDSGYRPDNCKWGTKSEQWHNRRDCKLDWNKVRQIREADPLIPYRALAIRFGVGVWTIGLVRRGKTWKEESSE